MRKDIWPRALASSLKGGNSDGNTYEISDLAMGLNADPRVKDTLHRYQEASCEYGITPTGNVEKSL